MPSRRDLANAIRALSMDAVQKAKSGHPGAPMGMADIAEVLWNDYLKHDPADPTWPDRDRFVMSNGHGSMLVYSLLHLTGYEVPLKELEGFRQLHSMTPGHPEFGLTPGVETTTGPLGQGLANSVGFALAEKILAAHFNRPGHEIVDHHTYVFTGDGCLMEGISHEACSLAGTLGLGKLIAFYDDNGISIDGEVRDWFTDDTPGRFEAYGWHVVPEVDGHDPEAVDKAIEQARSVTDKPSLICCKTVIGHGSPNKQGKAEAHGAPLGDDEIKLAREGLGWEHGTFDVPDVIYEGWDAREKGAAARQDWQARFDAYAKEHPGLAAEFKRRMAGDLPDGWAGFCEDLLKETAGEAPEMATRKASGKALESFGAKLPELIGGSADLSGSNNTQWSGSKAIAREDADGNYIFYGVREFAMTAIATGMHLHGGIIPYAGTFLTFSDYARNAVRMASLIGRGSIFVYTHDSLGLGEDGPTHQPVEHLASLRIIPNLAVWRPCDAVETVAAWQSAIERSDGPTAMALTRQGVPHQERSDEQLADIRRGGYVLRDCKGEPELILIGTGSEVGLCMEAAGRLSDKGVAVRVVSMPCTNIFDMQEEAYRAAVLPPTVTARVAVEAGVRETWWRYVGTQGRVVGIDQFGESAPAKDVFEHFGFTVDNVVTEAEAVLNSQGN